MREYEFLIAYAYSEENDGTTATGVGRIFYKIDRPSLNGKIITDIEQKICVDYGFSEVIATYIKRLRRVP